MHPLVDRPVPIGSVAIHWFGQSSFAFKDSAGTILLVDPYFPRQRPADRFVHEQPPLDEATLPPDWVLLTHDHGDHTCIESLLRIHAAFGAARFVGPSESVARMAAGGIPRERLLTVTAGESVRMGSMVARAVWAKPPQGVPAEGIQPPDVQHLGYLLSADLVRIYISGDPINSFAEHEELLRPIRQLRPDIGLLTLHPTEGEFPYFAGSAQMALRLGLRTAVPAHYACFVQRDYDPQAWATHLPADGPAPLIIPYNESVLYAAADQ